MKRIVLGMVLLLLMVTVGCCQEPEEPLQLTIKSDKEVYEVGESISISCEAKNISNKLIKTRDYYKPGTFHIYLTNEYGQKHELNYIDLLRAIIPLELLPGKSVKLVGVTFILPNNNSKLEKYKVLGKHSIYAVDGNLTSNTIDIEVKAKK